ncbi:MULTISPECIES: DUF423 domain-containing protein [Anoxybacillus]|uniref:Uncharacterized membrane protein YgdD (TMEM256/DUF423 family) n=1 Tax=Anoxybacillus tengchongensis TaxID=576944 RepID=A0A7W9YPY9_9BACL|nr:DUF423 domain-containing protein [Anoxybacillus tengchongensis]MBB6176200.1 uncharacterized membrane protein YgdD (TMEM256/DUF423 family) [Anoxybacillus tengchongensis]
MKIFTMIASISAALCVALGAFGAHVLEGKIPERYMDTWQKAVQYQMFHTIGLFIVALLATKWPNVTPAGWLMVVGIVFFSGSLYVLSLTQIKILGAITPFGGVSFIIAWLLLAYVAMKQM